MNKDLLQDYFQKSMFSDVQAEALARIFAEFATKSDLAELQSELKGDMAALRAGVQAELSAMATRLTWRMIAVVGFFGSAITILNAFLG